MKQKFILAYLGSALLYALYDYFFGDVADISFFTALGRGLVWPAIVFPVFGQIVTGLLVLIFVIVLMAS